jgi:hypothetical protein
MPSPDYLDGIVVDVVGKVEARLAEDAERSQVKPLQSSGEVHNDR